MEWMICVDDNNGVCFNERRQSRDRVVTADMAETAVGRLPTGTPACGNFLRQRVFCPIGWSSTVGTVCTLQTVILRCRQG